MDILLLNDATFAPYLPPDFRVLSVGPQGHYVMPGQDRFDLWLDGQLEQSLDTVLERCRTIYPNFEPQVIVLFETALNYFYRGIEDSPALTLWRVVDSHLFFHWQPQYSQLFDGVLVAQRDYLELFQAHNPRACWLPLHTNARVHFDRGLERELPVSFVGSMDPRVHPERVAFFRALQERVPVELFSGKSQLEISEIYNRSHIVLNECLHRDLNYRLFEALSNGALCVTPAIEAGQSGLFVNGVDLVEYEDKNVSSAADAIVSLLADPPRLERIRRHGYETVHAAHDISHRVATVVRLISEMRASRPERRLEARRLVDLISLLSEFSFELRMTAGGQMQDIIGKCVALDPSHTAYYLTSLSGMWLRRGKKDAARYFLDQAQAIPIQDPILEPAQRGLARLVR